VKCTKIYGNFQQKKECNLLFIGYLEDLGHVDILINNAGIANRQGLFESTEE
jgi:NAD(P)-dependent dehydrogenase (short-subunit alcohol dehydrogenase family)